MKRSGMFLLIIVRLIIVSKRVEELKAKLETAKIHQEATKIDIQNLRAKRLALLGVCPLSLNQSFNIWAGNRKES